MHLSIELNRNQRRSGRGKTTRLNKQRGMHYSTSPPGHEEVRPLQETNCWLLRFSMSRFACLRAKRTNPVGTHQRLDCFVALLPAMTRDPRLALHIILLAGMFADSHDHRDTFGIAVFGDGRLVSLGPELPGVPVTQNENRDSVRTVGVGLELRPCHRNEFGFGLDGLAHDDGFPPERLIAQVAVSASVCRGDDNGVRRYLAASTRFHPTIAGSEPVGDGSALRGFRGSRRPRG